VQLGEGCETVPLCVTGEKGGGRETSYSPSGRGSLLSLVGSRNRQKKYRGEVGDPGLSSGRGRGLRCSYGLSLVRNFRTCRGAKVTKQLLESPIVLKKCVSCMYPVEECGSRDGYGGNFYSPIHDLSSLERAFRTRDREANTKHGLLSGTFRERLSTSLRGWLPRGGLRAPTRFHQQKSRSCSKKSRH